MGGPLSPQALIAVLGFGEPDSLASWLDGATPEQREAVALLLLSVSTEMSGGDQ